MTPDEVLDTVEQILQHKRFGYIERLVFRQSWVGQTYSEMAQGTGYGSDYIKEVGSQLWQDLSGALGRRVTKKNLHLVLKHYYNSASHQKIESQQDLRKQKTQGGLSTLPPESEVVFPGDPLPLDSPFYVHRPPLEEWVCTEIKQLGCFIRIKAPRKMGKSSLFNRIIAHATDQGYQIVYLDFREADEAIFSSLDKFLRWLCANTSRQLHLAPRLDEYWDADMGSKVSCKIYFEAYLLEHIDRPVIFALNEINRVLEHPQIAHDFLPMLRFWHEQTKQNQTWQHLRLVVVYTTEIYIQLKLNQSPFNVGLTVSLPPFTMKQVQDLALRYGLDWAAGESGAQRLNALHEMLGGHPYLVSLAMYHLYRQETTLLYLLQAAPTPSGIFSEHLRENLSILQSEPQLASAMQQIVSAEESVQLDAITAYKLESMGLIDLSGNQATPSCELYKLYFRQQLGAAVAQV
jgi:hypothetical protein